MDIFSKIIKCKEQVMQIPVLQMQGNLRSITKFRYSSTLRFKTRFGDDFGETMDEITRYNGIDNIQWHCGFYITMRYVTDFKRVQRGTTR